METQSDYQENEVEVQIADAGDRIIAYLINVLMQTVVGIPFGIGLMAGVFEALEQGQIESIDGGDDLALLESIINNINMTWILIGVVVFVAYVVWQIIMMSTRGQSFGKQIMNIAVIKEDGGRAGFLGVVLLREVVFMLGAMIVGLLMAILVGQYAIFDLVYYGLFLVCFVMIFKSQDRRTLQDKIAGTVVVKLPSNKKTKSTKFTTK